MQKKWHGLEFECPSCRIEVNISALGGACSKCGLVIKFNSSGSLVFLELDESPVSDGLDLIKSRLKRLGKFYNWLIQIIAPVLGKPQKDAKTFIDEIHLPGAKILNLGSGSSQIDSRVMNFDLLPYSEVDVICTLSELPLKTNSIDGIINIAVLEHVPNPSAVVSEFLRVLKPGGRIYCFIPFMQGYHASPWDFQRFTKSGMKELFKEFDIEDLKPVGPTSGFLWIFQEWVATLFSFGSRKLHLIIWMLLVAITWPIKYLDLLLRHYPTAENITTGFSIWATKPE